MAQQSVKILIIKKKLFDFIRRPLISWWVKLNSETGTLKYVLLMRISYSTNNVIFYVLIEGKWTFYGYTRITSILKQTNSGWKLAHQHASFPDTRAEEGEQMAAEKIKEENIQLRDAVKRRTIELEEKKS